MSFPLRFNQRATEYAADPTTGRYTVQVQTEIPCILAMVSTQPAASGPERAELARLRHLLWDPTIEIGPSSRLEVAGVLKADGSGPARWTIQAGTQAIRNGPLGTPSHWRADLVEAR